MSGRTRFYQDLANWAQVYDAPPPPEGYHPASPGEALLSFLLDLRFLRNVPISYLVPDARMLPPESVRFFHVDPVWTDRLVEGALSAASVGTADELSEGGWAHYMQVVYSAITGVTDSGPAPAQGTLIGDTLVAYLRQSLDGDVLAEMSPGAAPIKLGDDRLTMSGMLMRSEIVRRWPKLRVEAYSDRSGKASTRTAVGTPFLVAEGILLVLFAGVPARVEVIEPDEGTRFGVEPQGSGTATVQYRAPDGSQPAGVSPLPITYRDKDLGVLDVVALAAEAQARSGAPAGSAHAALCLQQTPYAQVFINKVEAIQERLVETRAWIGKIKSDLGGNP